MKRFALGIAALAAVAATAVPASAHVEFKYCFAGTYRYVCGACVIEAGIDTCRK